MGREKQRIEEDGRGKAAKEDKLERDVSQG